MRDRRDQGAHGPAILDARNDQNGDFLEAGGDRLLHATMALVDDKAIAAIGFGGDDGWLHDADSLDRGQKQGVGLRAGLGTARPVGVVLERAGIDKFQLHGNAPLGLRTGPLPVLFHLLPEDIPRPAERAGRCNCARASLPGWPSGASSALRGTTGRDRDGSD
jgi:hypothetical protein